LAISAIDSITPALEHTKQQLFKPFHIGQWTKLAFVGLLAGELGSSSFSRSNFTFPQRHGGPSHLDIPNIPSADLALIGAIVAVGIVAAIAIGIILMYVSSVMRFVLFDSILLRECHIRWSWTRRLGAGWRYFVWKLIYLVLLFTGVGVLLGAPLAFAIASRWYNDPKAHLVPLVLGGACIFIVFFSFFMVTAVVFVLTKDFVVPQMALENLTATEGWRRLWTMMKAEKGAYASYVVMKIVLAIVAAVLVAIAALIVGLVYVVPTAGLSLLAILTGKAAGMTWNVETITLAVAVGIILLGIFLYLVSLVSVPVIVFFPAYSMYFFADRYPRLKAALNPALPPPGTAPVSP
jgi:hypothetical protein